MLTRMGNYLEKNDVFDYRLTRGSHECIPYPNLSTLTSIIKKANQLYYILLVGSDRVFPEVSEPTNQI